MFLIYSAFYYSYFNNILLSLSLNDLKFNKTSKTFIFFNSY